MKPIVSNKAFESIDRMACKDQSLTFTALSIEDIEKQSQSELAIHLTQVRSHIHSYIHTYIHTYIVIYTIRKYVHKYIHPHILQNIHTGIVTLYVYMYVCMYVYKFLHKASAVLQSSNNVTAGIAAHVQDRATVLSYLSNIAYSAEVGYHTYIHAYMHTHIICIYMHTHPNKH